MPYACQTHAIRLRDGCQTGDWQALDDSVLKPYILSQEIRETAMQDQTEKLEGAPLIRPSNTDHPLYENVVDACRTVFDPEIPVNIYDLGLIYTIEIDRENSINITMTLTAPGCPVAGEMPGWVSDAVNSLPGVKDVNVDMTFDPPWGMDMMSDEARLELGFM